MNKAFLAKIANIKCLAHVALNPLVSVFWDAIVVGGSRGEKMTT